MKLKYNTSQQVNKLQYDWVKNNLKGLFAHRKDNKGNFFIKPLMFHGHKNSIENILNQLA